MRTQNTSALLLVVAVSFSGLLAPRVCRGEDEIAALKQKVESQQEQIDQLRAALEEQRRSIERLARALPATLPDQPLASAAITASPGSAAGPAPRTTSSPDGAATSAPTARDENQPPRDERAAAQSKLEAVAETVTQTNQRVAGLEKNFAAATSAGVAGWDGSHPFIRSRDGNLTMSFGGSLQLDWRSYTGTATPPSTFVIRRARFEAGGQLSQHYEYFVQLDAADTSSRVLRDGYLNVNYTTPFQIKFGQFKAPFSQEELQSAKYIDFVERSSVNNLTPARSPGVMLHGKLAAGSVEYYAGVFNSRRELNPNTASTPEAYLRLRFSPFKSFGPHLLQNFSFGGAFADGRHRGGDSFMGQTASRSAIFFEAMPVNGEIVRANGEFWWRYRSFSLRGEYDQTHQYRENLCANGTNCPGVIGKGLVVQATYLLTGEEKTETGITPKRSFLGAPRGPGAWELALRYENLRMSDSLNPNRAEGLTLGVNWWMNKFVRYQSNFAFERIKDAARSATPGENGHFGYLSRIQVIF